MGQPAGAEIEDLLGVEASFWAAARAAAGSKAALGTTIPTPCTAVARQAHPSPYFG